LSTIDCFFPTKTHNAVWASFDMTHVVETVASIWLVWAVFVVTVQAIGIAAM
jgi:hypothetical protein